MRKKAIITLLALTTLSIGLVGCGKSEEKETELQTNVQTETQTVEKEVIKVTITDDNGNKITLEGETKVDSDGKTVIEAKDTEGNKVVLDADIKKDTTGNTVVENVVIKNPDTTTIVADNKETVAITKPIEKVEVETETKVEVIVVPKETTSPTTKPTTPTTPRETEGVIVKPTEKASEPETEAPTIKDNNPTEAPTVKPTTPVEIETQTVAQQTTQAPTVAKTKFELYREQYPIITIATGEELANLDHIVLGQLYDTPYGLMMFQYTNNDRNTPYGYLGMLNTNEIIGNFGGYTRYRDTNGYNICYNILGRDEYYNHYYAEVLKTGIFPAFESNALPHEMTNGKIITVSVANFPSLDDYIIYLFNGNYVRCGLDSGTCHIAR